MWGTAAPLLPLLAIIFQPLFVLLPHVLGSLVLPFVAQVCSEDVRSADVECNRDLPPALRRDPKRTRLYCSLENL